MIYLANTIRIHAPREQVWDAVANLEEQASWMSDVGAIHFATEQHQGMGCRFTCITRVGPLHTNDVMEVIRWEPPRMLGITHQGLVKGRGLFRLTERHHITSLTWHEELVFPPRLGGWIGERSARPLLMLVWKRDLERLNEMIESSLSGR